MKTEQLHWTSEESDWGDTTLIDAQIVFCFGSNKALESSDCYAVLKERYGKAYVVGCSTAGEIIGTEVHDDSVVATALQFASTRVLGHTLTLQDNLTSLQAGRKLAGDLDQERLVHVLVLCDGLVSNGSDLARGMAEVLPDAVAVTGGLAGDGANFERTHVVADAKPAEKTVVVIGFYGDDLTVGYGSLGGWDTFGPERVVTRAEGNVLYELDGKSALQLYKEYLGEHADGLPATGLLFPLSVRVGDDEKGLVRTILAIDEKAQSMTFAGDIPVGSCARLMSANFSRLVDGASGAASAAQENLSSDADVALLISCVGRKMVLKQRIEEEVEAVQEVVGSGATLMGFYSYGEIAPFVKNSKCELHNQTMTITTFSERTKG